MGGKGYVIGCPVPNRTVQSKDLKGEVEKNKTTFGLFTFSITFLIFLIILQDGHLSAMHSIMGIRIQDSNLLTSQ
jgi:hypothetical protein